MELKTFFLLTILSLAIVPTFSQDTFSDLPMSQQLIGRANTAISDLRTMLNEVFTCDGGCSCSGWSRKQFSSAGRSQLYDFKVPQLRCTYAHQSSKQLFWTYRRLRRKIQGAADVLDEVKQAFQQYNNVIVGMGNQIEGDDNFVIGDYNEFSGSSNWVFSSNLSTNSYLDGVLVIGRFVIELQDLLMSEGSVQNMIHCTGDSDSSSRRSRWWKTTARGHRVCA